MVLDFGLASSLPLSCSCRACVADVGRRTSAAVYDVKTKKRKHEMTCSLQDSSSLSIACDAGLQDAHDGCKGYSFDDRFYQRLL